MVLWVLTTFLPKKGSQWERLKSTWKEHFFLSFWSLNKQNRTKADVDIQSTAADVSIFIVSLNTQTGYLPSLSQNGATKADTQVVTAETMAMFDL